MSSFDSNQYPGQDPSAGSAAAPGWYPVDNVSQRYWDGYEWTNNIAPLAPAGGGMAHYSAPTADQRNYALFMHLGSLFLGFLVPLIMWLIKKDESPFIDDHGKQLMNWNISLIIYFFVSFILVLVIIGIFMIFALALMHLVLSIMGAVAANKGDRFKYPMSIPFFS